MQVLNLPSRKHQSLDFSKEVALVKTHFKHLSWPCAVVVKFLVLQPYQFKIAILSSLWGDKWLKTHLDFPLRGNFSFPDNLSMFHVS